jgi:hypothetical protein
MFVLRHINLRMIKSKHVARRTATSCLLPDSVSLHARNHCSVLVRSEALYAPAAGPQGSNIRNCNRNVVCLRHIGRGVLYFSTTCRGMVSFMLLLLYLRLKSCRYPLNSRLGVSQPVWTLWKTEKPSYIKNRTYCSLF